MPDDQYRIRVPAVLKGQLEGRDPALPDNEYPPVFAPDLENVRIGKGLFETRLGFVIDSTAAVGSGIARLFTTVYLSDATRYRLLARGAGAAAQLYYMLVGTHTTWQTASGGGSLGNTDGTSFVGVTAKDLFYFLDRQGALRKFTPSSGAVASITGPATPAIAPQVQPTRYGYLGAAAESWAESDASNFVATTAGTYPVSPLGDRMSRLRVASSGAQDDTVSENTVDEEVPSHTIAFYLQADNTAQYLAFEVGTVEAAEFSITLKPPKGGAIGTAPIYPVYLLIGTVGRVNFKRFKVIAQPAAQRDSYVSRLVLPGRLNGRYRWRYTHYNSTTEKESEPSPISNNGTFSAFDLAPATYQEQTAKGTNDAFKKCALLAFESDDAGATTDKIRIYRNGGVPSLTKDSNGQDVWVRLTTLADVETTFSASPAAGATTFTVASVTNIAADDWLILDRGCATVEEFVQVGSISGTTITIKNSGVLKNAHSNKTTSTTLNDASVLKGDTTFVVASATGIAANDWLVLERNSASEEFVKVGSVAAQTITLHSSTPNLKKNHANGGTVKAVNHVQLAYLDNNGDESLDSSLRLEAERDDPPSAGHWIDKAPDGRIWIFRYTGKPLGVAVSNKPTDDRSYDYEVFPDGVDPVTRQSPVQGWRFNVTGDAGGDEIMWGGMFQQVPTVLTRRGLYQINAYAQTDWGPQAIVKVSDVGCLSGYTVANIQGTLFWAGPGPTIYAWDGQGSVRDISFERITDTLNNAPTAYFLLWYAKCHATQRGAYYRLRIVPNGATTATLRLDYNVLLDAWEPQKYYDSGGTAIAFRQATVWDGVSDTNQYYETGDADGRFYLMESGSTDNSQVLRIRFKTKRFDLGAVCQVRQVIIRLAAATDQIDLQVTTGGSEYGNVVNTFTNLSTSGSGDKEIRQRMAYNQKGRWVEFQISESMSNRPAVRDIEFTYIPIRGVRFS